MLRTFRQIALDKTYNEVTSVVVTGQYVRNTRPITMEELVKSQKRLLAFLNDCTR